MTTSNRLIANPSFSYPNPLATILPVTGQYPVANKKLNNVKTAAGSMRVLCLSDSKGWGTTNSPGNPPGPGGTSWPSQLEALLNSYDLPSQIGFSVPQADAANVPATDTRWVTAAGWSSGYVTYPSLLYGFGGAASWLLSVGATDGTFTPGNGSIDSFDVYYVTGPGLGTVHFAIDGPAAGGTSVNTGASPNGIGKTTVTAVAGTTHVLSMGAVSGAAVAIVGIDAYLSTGSVIRIGNAGVVGIPALSFADNLTISPNASLAMLKAYAPDLTILALSGTIDGVYQIPAAKVLLAVQQVVNAAQVSGDVILTSETPTLPISPAALGTTLSLEAQMRDLLYYYAQLSGLGYVDCYGALSPYATYQQMGYYNYTLNALDAFHLSPAGNGVVAYNIFREVSQI